jgi:ABC-type transport system involved in cytochrome c biogenesis ATPase subunit
VTAKYPHQLSGGQRQRVSFVRALAGNPEVILADEPISMLDVSIRMGILNMMAQLREEGGLSYLYTPLTRARPKWDPHPQPLSLCVGEGGCILCEERAA